MHRNDLFGQRTGQILVLANVRLEFGEHRDDHTTTYSAPIGEVLPPAGHQNGIGEPFSCICFAALGKGFQFGQNGGEKFRNRRMNMHCALYNRIRRLRIHGVQQNLDYFIASDAKDRST